MDKNILIADTAYAPTFSLAERIRRIKDVVISPLTSDLSRTFSGEKAPALINWNRCSTFSALAAVRQASSKQISIDTAVVAFNPFLGDKSELDQLSTIDKVVNTHVKAYLLLFRELDQYFNTKEEGLLIPILYRKSSELSFYEKIAASTFYATIEQMLQDKNRNYTIKAIDCGNLTISAIENLVCQIIQDSNNSKRTSKWFEPDIKNPLKSIFSKF